MSGFLLGTNVISELVKRRPDGKVTAWVSSVDENLLSQSVLTIGEIRKGVASLPATVRRSMLETCLDYDLSLRFAGRILPIDQSVADRWGILSAAAVARGKMLPVIDGLLAATALHHNLTLVTPNSRDIELTGVPVFNP